MVITCGMWGNPSTSKAILSLSERFNFPVLEDAAQSFGASTPYGREGLKGRIGCFSTHEYKLLSTRLQNECSLACIMLFNDDTDGVRFAGELAARGFLTDPYR